MSETEAKQPEEFQKNQKELPKEEQSVTKHSISINGKELSYTATAGTYLLKEEDGTPKASIFYIAYHKNKVKETKKRPITFSFNGGPGSSSVWLHLGLLGPRRVEMSEEGQALQPPYVLKDNEFSLLDATDLVFIDPVSTGYSRVIPGEKPEQFHNLEKDIESVGEFIRLYLTRTHRWPSPKFLIGESYGTTRAAGLSGFLQSKYGMYLNGIMLVSTILNFQTARFDIGNDLPYILILPTYTATAWYHKKLSSTQQKKSLKQLLKEVESFAQNEYSLALMKGASLSEKESEQMAQKLASFTGLSQAFLLQANLRIEIGRFVKELLREKRRTVGRLDSRITGIDRDSAGESFEYDPSYATIQGPFTATLNDYVRTELGFQCDLPYEILTSLHETWKYERHNNQYVNVGETLRNAMSVNSYLKVLVANGYYDLATPYFATEYTINHLDLDPSLQKNITMTYYESGHMMYIHLPTLAQQKKDLVHFIHSAIPKAAK